MSSLHETILSHSLVTNGMRDSTIIRQSSLGTRTFPPLLQNFNSANDEAYHPTDSNKAQMLQNIIDQLPAGVGTFLYNSGQSHLLVDGEFTKDLKSNGETISGAAGSYLSTFNIAVSRTDIPNLEKTIFHEAGHALSYSLGLNYDFIEPVSQSLLRELKLLEPNELVEIGENLGHSGNYFSKIIGYIEGTKEDILAPENGRNSVRHSKTLHVTAIDFEFIDDDLKHKFFPETLLEIDKLNVNLPEVLLRNKLSDHPDIRDAFSADGADISANGKGGPKNARFIADDRGEERKIYIRTDDNILDVTHYVTGDLRREESFAEIFENIVQGKVGENVLATYFPRTTEAVESVIKTLDMAYNSTAPDPDLNKFVPNSSPTSLEQ